MVNQDPAISADSEGIDRFISRFNLERFVKAGCLFSAVERAGDSLNLNCRWDGVGDGVVSIAASDGYPSFSSSANLVFRFVGAEVSRPWALLMTRLAMEARDMTFQD